MATVVGVPISAGFPDYGVTAGGQIIPVDYSKYLNAKFYRKSPVTAITNANWTKELLAQGQQIVIRNKPDVSVSDSYAKGSDFSALYEDLAEPSITLTVDKGVLYAFRVEEITARQSDISWVGPYLDDAAHKTTEKVEDNFLASIITQAHSSLSGLTAGPTSGSFNMGTLAVPLALDKTNATGLFSGIGTCLHETNADEAGFWACIPPAIQHLVNLGDLSSANNSGMGKSTALLPNGWLRNLYDVNIFKTNSTATQTTATINGVSRRVFYIPFGHNAAVTFCGQMTIARHITNVLGKHGDFYDGLFVHGWEVVKPTLLGVAVVTIDT
jgi:hypothetical protein